METLRIMAKEHGYIAEKNVDKFHSVWMGIIGNIGIASALAIRDLISAIFLDLYGISFSFCLVIYGTP